jgi:DNA-binding NtrC family response regulator
MQELLPDVLLFVGRVRDMAPDEIREALEGTGLPVCIAADVDEARAVLRFQQVKLMVVGLDDEENTWPLIRLGRGTKRNIPVACASGVLIRSRVLAALRRGAKTFLGSKFSAEDAQRKLAPLLAS